MPFIKDCPYLNLISEIQENHEEDQIVTKYFGQ